MKIAATVARYLMGLTFLVFGLNKFFNFIPTGPLPPGVAGEFTNIMIATKYMMLVGVFEGVSGILLLFNRYVPLALAFLAPVIVNILWVNFTMLPKAAASGLFVAICWALVYWRHRAAFAPLYKKSYEEA
jgi:putative oxidoreductase